MRFLVDEDFNNNLIRGLLRRNPGTDLEMCIRDSSKQTPSRGLIDRERRLVSRRAASDDDGERLWLHRRSILEDSKNLIRQFYELSHRRLVRWLGNKANRHSFTSTAPMTGG